MLKNAVRRSLIPRLGVAAMLLCAPPYAAATTRYVNDLTGTNVGTCTPIADACLTITFAIGVSAAGDVIRVAEGIYEENNISIPFDLAIIGSSPFNTEIDGLGLNRIFFINANLVRISRLTLRNGNAFGGNGGAIEFTGGQLFVTGSRLLDNDAALGGAIAVNGANSVLTVVSSTIRGNNATTSGGAIWCSVCGGVGLLLSRLIENTAAVYGGAIYAAGDGINFLGINTVLSSLSGNSADVGGAIFASAAEVHITQSNLALNEATFSDGGAVYATSSLNIVRSTFAYNTALANGGAIAVFGGGALYSANSTFSGNSAGSGGAISLISNFGFGPSAIIGTATFFGNDCYALFLGCAGHISHGGPSTLELYNSIVTGGLAAKCFSPAANGAHNLIDDGSCGSGVGPPIFNLGAVTGLDPVLAYNGGPTRTHDLDPISNAIDTGRNPACRNPWTGTLLVQDQRGLPRPVDYPGVGGGVRCDIGALEKQP